ncbi:MAG: type II secretion system F family protein [Candidatus Omnitrophota bacterium]
MAKFNYVSKDRSGKSLKGQVDAVDRAKALEILRSRDLLILKLEEAKPGSFSSLKLFSRKKVSLDELVIFTRQLATLTGAGITIVTSLDTLSEQAQSPAFKAAIIDARDSVNTGSSLSEAMEKHRGIFSDFFINMVRAGESGGMLDEVLERVAAYLEKTSNLQRKIKSAMMYPAAVMIMAFGILVLLLLKVIPVFKDIFSSFGAGLPGPTQFLIDLSDGMRKYFFPLVVLGALIFWAFKWYASTKMGMLKLDGLKLKLPVFGVLQRKVAISKFSRTLSTLVRSGVPILQALEIVSKTAGNTVVERTIDKVRDNVREGESISDPMERSGIFPPLVTRMISVGEKTGELEKMLTKIADFFDDQVDVMVDSLTSLLEPLIIAFLGIVIGGIVICMFLPIFQMSELLTF